MNKCRHQESPDNGRCRRGVILLVTLVILVILSTLGYTLCVQVAARRHRDQYMIDYCAARHACASGLKYALASVGTLQFDLVSRPNEPDFSDVFAMSEPQYQKLLEQAAAMRAADANLSPESLAGEPLDRDSLKKAAQTDTESEASAKDAKGTKSAKSKTPKNASQKDASPKKASLKKAAQIRDARDINDINDFDPNGGLLAHPKPPEIRGPYGPPWPLVTEPMELEIGSAQVKIEVEDENAKYPLGWAMLADEKLKPVAGAGWSTFCEWMGYQPPEIDLLTEDLVTVSKAKPFKIEFKQETENVELPANVRNKITRPTVGAAAAAARRTSSRKPVTVQEQIDRQNKEYAKLLHSSLINRDLLSRPSIASDTRKESALKYLGLWATRHVNVNTAPRQVLEAALTFGSAADAPKIAEQIIQCRRTKPVADVNELKQAVPRYSTAIDDCRTFITTKSSVFTIRITAVSGVARVTMVAAVSKEGNKVQPIAIISD